MKPSTYPQVPAFPLSSPDRFSQKGRHRLNEMVSHLPPFSRFVLTNLFHFNLGLYFQINAPDAEWNEEGGIYIFAAHDLDGPWRALFIGETDSFFEALTNHPRWQQAAMFGATRIHTRVYPSPNDRKKDLKTLLRWYRPILNRLPPDLRPC